MFVPFVCLQIFTVWFCFYCNNSADQWFFGHSYTWLVFLPLNFSTHIFCLFSLYLILTFWMFCFWSEPILQRTFDLWRFFMMQDVSSIYDLFDPKLREISAKHHFMTCTTHSVSHKVCKDLRLNLVKLGKKHIKRLNNKYTVFSTTDPNTTIFGLWMYKWWIFALVEDPLKSH